MVDSSSSGAPSTSLGSYLPALDGLRAIAVSLVIWYHAPYVFLRTPGGQEGHWAHAHGGWMGVDLFFVISGYLITSILLRSRANPRQLSMFWARRALRILPLAFLYLAILMLLAPRDPLHIGFGDFDDWWLYFAYLGNLHIVADGWQPPVLMILWSLAVEEQFYLLWPLAVRFTRPQALLRLCLSLVVIAPLVRVVVDDTLGYPAAYVFPLGRADALASGGALAVLCVDPATRGATLRWCGRLALPGLAFVGGVLAVGLSLPAIPPWFNAIGYSVIAVAFTAVVGVATDPPRWLERILTSPPLAYLGRISYGLYLWHCLVGAATEELLLRSHVQLRLNATALLAALATVLVASVSWFAFERPLNRLKRHFPQHGPRRHGTVAP